MKFDYPYLTQRLERYHSKRLALREFTISDTWPLWSATRNAGFNELLAWTSPETERALVKRVDAMLAEMTAGRMSAVSAVVKATGEWVAVFRFFDHRSVRAVCTREDGTAMDPRDDDDAVECGIWTNPPFWSGGYGSEITKLAVDGCALELAPSKLVARTAVSNLPAHKILATAGFERTYDFSLTRENGAKIATAMFEMAPAQHESRHRALTHYMCD